MGKSSKNKKNKVPKITEEQYVDYVNSLKTAGQVRGEQPKEATMCCVEKSK